MFMFSLQGDEEEDVLPSLPKSKPQSKAHMASLFSIDSTIEDETVTSAGGQESTMSHHLVQGDEGAPSPLLVRNE